MNKLRIQSPSTSSTTLPSTYLPPKQDQIYSLFHHLSDLLIDPPSHFNPLQSNPFQLNSTVTLPHFTLSTNLFNHSACRISQTANSSSISWDDWVPQDRLRKNTDESRELAANLKKAAHEQSAKSSKSSTVNKTRRGQTDLASGRGSEERTSSIPARGTKRARDNDIEKVRKHIFLNSFPFPKDLWSIVRYVTCSIFINFQKSLEQHGFVQQWLKRCTTHSC